MDSSFRLEIPDHVLHQSLQGETVLLDLEREIYFGLDEVGTRFWEAIGAGGGLEEAVDTILEDYQVERVELEADLRRLIEDLVDKGLLEVSDVIE